MYNPLVKTITPAGAAPEPRDPLTEAQQRWIRETPHTAQRAAMLLLYSGLRRSEATALTWADIDLDDATITVSKGYDFRAKKVRSPRACRRPRRQYPQGPRRLSPHPAGRLPLRAPQPQRPADD